MGTNLGRRFEGENTAPKPKVGNVTYRLRGGCPCWSTARLTQSVLGKAAQRVDAAGLKGANAAISKTLPGYKSLAHKGLVGESQMRHGNPLALACREAASVEMLTELINYLSGDTLPPSAPSLSQTRECPKDRPLIRQNACTAAVPNLRFREQL